MADKIYYNAPCELYKGFLSDRKHEECLENILNFVIYALSSKKGYNKDTCREYARDCLGVNCSNPASNYNSGRKLFNELMYNDTKPAYFSVSNEMYWHFHDRETSFDERVSALAYLAIKSMIGKREYIKTNMTLLCSRMDGRTRYRRGQELSPEVAKYTNRYWSHKLMNDLFTRYGVVFYSGCAAHKVRGFYCSVTLSMVDLIRKVEKVRNEARAQPADPLREAQRKALEEIGKATNSSP